MAGDFILFNLFNFFTRQFQESSTASSACERERKKERERKRALEPVPRYVIARLVSLFPASPILALLVGKGVTTPTPSSSCNTSSNNTNSEKKFKNSKSKEICYFQH
jgi:hypothetical protein